MKTWITIMLMFWSEELVFQFSNMLVAESVSLPEFKNKNHPIILKCAEFKLSESANSKIGTDRVTDGQTIKRLIEI